MTSTNLSAPSASKQHDPSSKREQKSRWRPYNGLISEIVSVPGAELVGPLPAELQAMTVISAGIVTTASEPDAARVLLEFLTSPAAEAVIKATGMEPGS
jgi:ABC-type molybdate transport system substrate-binding protein